MFSSPAGSYLVFFQLFFRLSTVIWSFVCQTHFDNTQLCQSEHPKSTIVHSQKTIWLVQHLTMKTCEHVKAVKDFNVTRFHFSRCTFYIRSAPNTFANITGPSFALQKYFQTFPSKCQKTLLCQKWEQSIMTDQWGSPIRVLILIFISCMLENERSNMLFLFFFLWWSDHCRGD